MPILIYIQVYPRLETLIIGDGHQLLPDILRSRLWWLRISITPDSIFLDKAVLQGSNCAAWRLRIILGILLGILGAPMASIIAQCDNGNICSAEVITGLQGAVN